MSNALDNKMLKLIALLLVVVTVLISLTGCMFDLEKLSNDLTEVEEMKAEKMKEMATEYLNEKYAEYGDKFTAVGYTPPSWAYSHSSVIFDSEKHNPFRVEVQICKVDGEYVLTDNYYKLYMVEDAEKYFKEVVSRYHTPVEVRVELSLRPAEELGDKPTFYDYIKSGESWVDVYFITSESFTEEQHMPLLKEFASNKISGFFWFIKTEEDLLQKYSLSEIINTRPEIDNQIYYGIMEENGEFLIEKR